MVKNENIILSLSEEESVTITDDKLFNTINMLSSGGINGDYPTEITGYDLDRCSTFLRGPYFTFIPNALVKDVNNMYNFSLVQSYPRDFYTIIYDYEHGYYDSFRFFIELEPRPLKNKSSHGNDIFVTRIMSYGTFQSFKEKTWDYGHRAKDSSRLVINLLSTTDRIFI